ncbi:MAG: hypothetical protein JWO35_812 [Candidatus Saccharibacteria bacterium]|nr:hypothetical protein [Candidatus Saccharibacteria bacterium]
MKRFIAFTSIVALVGLAPGAIAFGAPNPSGTGRPNQDCVSIETQGGGRAPGHASSSPGSPFNEAGLDSPNGGIGGQHYEAAGAPSQYDVACYQVSQH